MICGSELQAQRSLDVDQLSAAIEILERLKRTSAAIANEKEIRGLTWAAVMHDSGKDPYVFGHLHVMGSHLGKEVVLPPEAAEKARAFVRDLIREYAIKADVDALAAMGISVAA